MVPSHHEAPKVTVSGGTMTIIRYATEEEKKNRPYCHTLVSSIGKQKELVIYKNPSGISMSHELSHLKLGHTNIDPWEKDSAYRYIKDEVEAWIDTYKKLKRPRHLYQRLNGIIYTVIKELGEDYNRAIETLETVMKEKHVPRAWMEDLKRIKKETAS